ncbi:MAG: hypothetical protein H6742_20010 [Alphaproteobacteria bacterium]|nr:hypothetical protein [Alphaproteobacteria bacterium]
MWWWAGIAAAATPEVLVVERPRVLLDGAVLPDGDRMLERSMARVPHCLQAPMQEGRLHEDDALTLTLSISAGRVRTARAQGLPDDALRCLEEDARGWSLDPDLHGTLTVMTWLSTGLPSPARLRELGVLPMQSEPPKVEWEEPDVPDKTASNLAVRLGTVALDEAPVADPVTLVGPHRADVLRCMRPAVEEGRFTLGEKAMLSLQLADGRGARPQVFGVPVDAAACLVPAMRGWSFPAEASGELTVWFEISEIAQSKLLAGLILSRPGSDSFVEGLDDDDEAQFGDLDTALAEVGGLVELIEAAEARRSPAEDTPRVELATVGLDAADQQAVESTLHRQRRRFQDCAERSVTAGVESLPVELQLHLALDAGTVLQATSQGGSAALQSCVTSAARTLRFPPDVDGPLDIHLTVEPPP